MARVSANPATLHTGPAGAMFIPGIFMPGMDEADVAADIDAAVQST
jgi:hypothetical protein